MKSIRWIIAFGCMVWLAVLTVQRRNSFRAIADRLAVLEVSATNTLTRIGDAKAAKGAVPEPAKGRRMRVQSLVQGRADNRVLIGGEWLRVGEMGFCGTVLRIPAEGRYCFLLDHDGGLVYATPVIVTETAKHEREKPTGAPMDPARTSLSRGGG